ncbi:Nuclear protein localization protein 4 [Dictyocoela muelleri]|nr:Nuclear protein localization protein 4 [Dictyocoela muelleri]
MIIKIHGPTKFVRIKIPNITELDQKIKSEFETEKYILFTDKEKTNKIEIKDITNGDTLYIDYKINVFKDSNLKNISHDLKFKDGIKRSRDKLLCQHGEKGMCSNCAPLDVWDKDYHKRMGIKYISYRSYIKMLEKSKFNNDDTKFIDDNKSTDVKKCTHGPNIKCIHCTDKKIILKPQQFRTCDHLEFDSENIVKEFLRDCPLKENISVKEKFGFLIGKYLDYERVPLGIKALVSAIYEPEQENFPDGFFINDLNPDIYFFLEKIGLEIVGMIYTNLNDKNLNDKNLNDKNLNDKNLNDKNLNDKNLNDKNLNDKNLNDKNLNDENFNNDDDLNILSSIEISFIASFQQFFSENNHSKFITAVLKKNKNREIIIEPFMISQQGQQLINENKLIPTLTTKFYNKYHNSIPIAYSSLNEYKLVVERIEKFIPSEYFIVKPTQGYKENPRFYNHKNLERVSKKKIAQYFGDEFCFSKFSNFSFIFRIFKDSNDFDKESINDFNNENDLNSNNDFNNEKDFNNQIDNSDLEFKINYKDLDLLINSIKSNDEVEFSKFQLTDGYKKIKKILERYSDTWSCIRCTFINKNNTTECEMCMLPRYD